MDAMINPSNQGHRQLRLLSGVAFIGMALCYITLFVIYGAVLNSPAGVSTLNKIAYLVENKHLFNFTFVLGYVLFACLLCFCVYAVDRLFQQVSSHARSMATLFGYFWVLVLLCTGMIGISANELLASYSPSNHAALETIYYAKILLTESLGGGIEFIGGVWVFVVGAMGWRHGLLSKLLAAFTMLKGAIGIVTLVCADSVLRDLFGLTGIVWFLWMGVALIKQPLGDASSKN